MATSESFLDQKFVHPIAKVLSVVSLLLCFGITVDAQIAIPHDGIIVTLSGTGVADYTGDGGQGASATLNGPSGIAVDSAGNIYFADNYNNAIREEFASTGIIATVVGNGVAGYTGDGGAAAAAELNGPQGVAIDAAGNIYIADQTNCAIRKVTASTGIISTVAGVANNLWGGYSGDGGPATDAELAFPMGVSLDANGNIYFADQYNGVIRKVTVSTGIISTVAGNGSMGYTGDGGLATSAELNFPSDVHVDASGNLFIADYNNQVIREVNASTGIITTIAGNGTPGYSGDFGPASSAMLASPIFLAIDSPGNLYISDSANNAIRKITASTGIITTVAGTGAPDETGASGYAGDGGLATAALLNSPLGIAVAPAGNFYSTVNLYFADAGNNVIRAAGGYRTAYPTFSPISATYSTAQTVTISDVISGTTIYYTTDGTTPTISSTVYSGPITVNSTETLSAIAVTSDGLLSAVGTAPYTITQVSPTINFSSGFTSEGLSLMDAVIVNGALQLSDGNGGERRAAWFTNPISSQAFTSDFNYQITSPIADGITLTLQNDPTGIDALGYAGDNLGYGGIASSVAIKYDMYNNFGEGSDSTGFYIDGALPTLPALDMTASGLILHSDDLMHVHVTYDGTALTWTISDTTTNASFTESTVIDIPTVVGGNTAYVGLTGSTGTLGSTQNVTGWTLISGSATTFAATPAFSPVSGTYSTAQVVAISDTTSGATIYYTTDGTTPTTASAVYSTPITVAATGTLNAIAVAAGYYNSTDAQASYTISSAASVSVTPASATLSGGQTQQFSASVSNSSNTAVTWTISPTGTGTISASGLYTAPASVTSRQTVTVIATSQADTTKSASATVTLSPPPCVSNGYSYERSITIDHRKVPNTDQTNFPISISGTYPSLATVTNGGHLQNANGYDILFTSDLAGQNSLDYEIDSYDPTTGAIAFWVRIPTLSHTADTTVYMWYGNSGTTTSQANPTGVWDSNYKGVWHLPNGSTLSANDSTTNASNGTVSGATAALGEIGGAASFNGSTSYIQVPTQDIPSNITVSAWVYSSNFNQSGMVVEKDAVNQQWELFFEFGSLKWRGGSLTAVAYPVPFDNAWHYVAATQSGTSASLFIDGASIASGTVTALGNGTSTSDNPINIGRYNSGYYYSGSIDEVRISSVVRSADWIATEYNNESSPSTFYAISSENTVAISPGIVSLYALQSQQFTAISSVMCSSGVIWSINPSGIGNINSEGLYTAPSSISVPATVAITATSQADPTKSGNAIVRLATPLPTMTLAASAQSPYMVGSSQGFTATVKNPDGTPVSGALVSFNIAGVNNVTGSGTTDANGIVSYSYVGSNSGNDNIQASSSVGDVQIQSNNISVLWSTPPVSGEGSVVLVHPSIGITGLCGAFTDTSGTVIEPISIGASPISLVVPAGATQLQLGVDDNRFADNSGPGFVVEINGLMVTVPPTAMPWVFIAGGMNTTYPYGLDDGTNPIIALSGLTQGQAVSVAYQSGIVSAGSGWPSSNADGDQAFITGISSNLPGIYFPTLYTTGLSYAVGQSVALQAIVTNGSGTPLANVPVNLDVTGANARQFQTTTNSAGVAAFAYTGLAAGTDTVEARALPSGNATLESNLSTVTWVAPISPAPSGSLALTPGTLQPLPARGTQLFTVLAKDASGAPISNVSVSFVVAGVDNFEFTSITDASGNATFTYQDTNSGTAFVVAIAFINGTSAFSNEVAVPWTLPPATTTTTNGSGSTIDIGISAIRTIVLPNSLQLNGTVTDSNIPSGATLAIQWSQVSGPGAVTFTTPQQAVTAASFPAAGNYVLELSANDSSNSGAVQIPILVIPAPGTRQGWIGNPINNTAVSGLVPISVVSGTTLQSGVLSYYPATGAAENAIVLNANTTGSGQIGTLDTTMLTNGSYWIQLQATDTSGDSEYNLVFVTVVGNYKPGRVTSTVTDLVVPATGLAINIQRTYDSLNASTSGDFGYGWSLGTTVNLSVDTQENVTFTLGGLRRTFYFAPQPAACAGLLCPFNGFIWATYTAEPGFNGTLTSSSPGCSSGLDLMVLDGGTWICETGGTYNPPGYIYTDPTGTQYTISANGSLQSVVDRSGNALTITPAGITSSTGLSVPFVRDAQNRITQITDPVGNIYQYTYDASGNLASVTYPNTAQPSTYTYDTNHLYLSGTDFRNNPLPSSAYYSATDTDENGNPLSGRLKSVTDGLGETTGYVYNLSTNTTTITYPPDASGNVGTATMVYDSYGDVLTSTDPLGHTTTNVYDANYKLTSTTDPLGHTTSYTYDSNGNKTSTTYPQTGTSTNTTSSTVYNQYSEPISTTDELGNVRTFNYDANYNPQGVTDTINGAPATLMSTLFNANSTLQAGAIGYDITAQPNKASQFTYDGNGNLASKTDALGRTTSYTYDTLGHKLTMAQPPINGSSTAAATTTYQYDAFGNLTQTSAPLGRTTYSQYDANGNKTSDTDANGHVTTYQFDALNRLTLTTYPGGTTSSTTYDFRGNAIDQTDQAGHVTLNHYDLAGRLTSIIQAYGTSSATTTIYAYDNAGRKVSETDALGHATAYTYDSAGNLIATAGVKGNFQYGYDNARNQVSMTDANSHTTAFQYDARKRQTVTTYPDATGRTNAYDGPGNLASVTDQAGNVVHYTYDAANQLQTVVQTNSPNSPLNTNTYGYDSDGSLASSSDANSHITATTFNLLYQLTAKTLPDGSLTESRGYDPAGNLVSLTHFNGVTTTYTYDNLNRLLSRATPGETTISHTYTATGKYASTTDASGSTTYTYDTMDRLTAKATPEGTLNYTFDAAGHVASIVSSNTNGASISYTYDDLNRLSTVVDNRLGSGANTTTYSYDSASNVANVAYPNGVQTSFTYDQLNRVSTVVSPNSGYSYQRGPTGNNTSAVELSGRTSNWTYDGIYRLTNETVSSDPASRNGSIAYGLDPVGNRLSANSTLSGINSGSSTFDADDRMASETYDANGNTLATGGKTFAYDAENHLTSMNGGAVTILYDGFGNRVAKTVSGVTTHYLVEDDMNPTGYPQVFDEIVGGAVTRTYTYGLQRISENQILSSAWTPSFYGYDGGSNVRQLTNAAGAVTDSYQYDAFGNSFTLSGTTPNNYLYRGEQYDSDLNFYYLRARYYNPLTGRFLSRDPKGLCNCNLTNPASLHAYGYASADPVNRVDPSGRADAVEEEGIDSEIDLQEVGRKTVPKGAFWGGIGLTGLGLQIACLYYTDAAGVSVVGQNLGSPQSVTLLGAICSALSSKMPGRPLGPYPAPFYPDEKWATSPGSPWRCEADADGWITSCRAPCPDGGEQWITWDPGTKYGEPPHWDVHLCNNTTCKIYLDNTSTCPPGSFPWPE